jgi:hypothetical protein
MEKKAIGYWQWLKGDNRNGNRKSNNSTDNHSGNNIPVLYT